MAHLAVTAGVISVAPSAARENGNGDRSTNSTTTTVTMDGVGVPSSALTGPFLDEWQADKVAWMLPAFDDMREAKEWAEALRSQLYPYLRSVRSVRPKKFYPFVAPQPDQEFVIAHCLAASVDGFRVRNFQGVALRDDSDALNADEELDD